MLGYTIASNNYTRYSKIETLPDGKIIVQIGTFKDLSYPLYFLDFETFQPAIPLYDDSSPYQQIPFQYSLHWIEHEGGELKHTEFLAYPGSDPRRALAEHFCHDIPLGNAKALFFSF